MKIALFRHFFGSDKTYFSDIPGGEHSPGERITDWVDVDLVIDADLVAAAGSSHKAKRLADIRAELARLEGGAA